MNLLFLHGWHGHQNAGDDAFAAVLATELKRRFQTQRLFVEKGDASFCDLDEAHNFAKRLRPELSKCLSYHGDPFSLFQSISECSSVISTRLHGCVFAYLAGVPFHMIDYSQKCRDFAETIGHSLHSHSFPESDQIRNLLDARLSESMPTLHLERSRERAALNFDFDPENWKP